MGGVSYNVNYGYAITLLGTGGTLHSSQKYSRLYFLTLGIMMKNIVYKITMRMWMTMQILNIQEELSIKVYWVSITMEMMLFL